MGVKVLMSPYGSTFDKQQISMQNCFAEAVDITFCLHPKPPNIEDNAPATPISVIRCNNKHWLVRFWHYKEQSVSGNKIINMINNFSAAVMAAIFFSRIILYTFCIFAHLWWFGGWAFRVGVLNWVFQVGVFNWWGLWRGAFWVFLGLRLFI